MLPALCHGLLACALSLAPRGFLRPRPHQPHPAGEGGIHQLWYWIDDYRELVFPLLALAVLALVYLGIRRGMTTNVAELQRRQERKDAIVRMMRAKLLVNAGAVAAELRIDHFAAAALLDDLVREGKLVPQKTAGGVTNYRLKGL